MAGVFTLLLIFATLEYLGKSGGADTEHTDHPTSDVCPNTWQFYSAASNKCKCGNDIHGAVLCNATTNDVHLLACYCMTLNKTGDYEVGKCFIGCAHDHSLSHKAHTYNPVPQDTTKLNQWMCRGLRKNGTMCGDCLPNYSLGVYSYDLKCHKCSSSRFQNIAKFTAAAFGPLTLFYVLVVVFKVSATSSKLSSYVIFSQWIAEPLNVRVVLIAIHDYPKIDILARLLASAYGIWNLDFFCTLYGPICLDVPLLLTLALDYTPAFYSLFLIMMTYLLIELHSRNVRIVIFLWRHIEHVLTFFENNWSMHASMVNVFATFFLLSYVKILSVSFMLLIPTILYDIHGNRIGYFLYYDASIQYFGREHLPYGVTAVAVLLVFVIIPTLFLTLYPFKWFQQCLNCCRIRHPAIHTFADCYLGWFTDGTQAGTRDRRFVMSLYLGLRIVIFIFYAFVLNGYVYAFGTVALITFSIVIALLRPYKEQWEIYNVINPAMTLMVALWYGTVICILIAREKAFEFIHFSAALSFIVALLPLVCMTCMVVYWLFKHSRAITRGLKMMKAKIRGRCSEYEVLDSEDHVTVPHRMEYPDQYHDSINAQDSNLVNIIQS